MGKDRKGIIKNKEKLTGGNMGNFYNNIMERLMGLYLDMGYTKTEIYSSVKLYL